ncbi:hypothetical protein H206_03511 [Candidatus Electrothrix aarhusensis]|uniref:DUF4365 domain-containing protein n=1 Tax=Candidatus Electrothrix aarhusensis TaxID=1859131 RepID=A0A3S3QT30_9BACT|nr:hypothetical protein H206_03511 [Candidatus Electrothrix aarhusensis]
MPGAIAKNAQEGTRSEYLAQYALSAFGTAIPVPHPEDSGIDMYCTLGRRIGRRFLVENPYFVQIKSHPEPICYEGFDEVKWLLSHKYPFLICIVNKGKARIELYQTLAISTLIAKKNFKKIILHPTTKEGEDYFSHIIEEDSVDIFLGNPIARFTLTNFSDNQFKKKISDSIKSWIELDQENINLKETGYTLYRIPESWKTNEKVEALKFNGNFKDSFETPEIKHKFYDLFFKMLSQLVNQAASEKNLEKYESLTDFIRSIIENNSTDDSFGVNILSFCLNKGNEHLGISERLKLFQTPKK